MENLNHEQAALIAKVIAAAWDELPQTEEQEFGPATEAKANRALDIALKNDEVLAAGITLSDEQISDLRGQFHVYLDSAENWGDITRMELELAELFAAD